jgi:very-short-patch-repair endonuclease
MELFTRNIEELFTLTSHKDLLARHLKKNYKENIHYIIEKNKYNFTNKEHKRGGQNKINYLLTEEVFEIFSNSYNLRNRYITNINDNIKQINLCMCIENQTIGFIENSYKDVINIKRQFPIGKYRTDLYFIDYKLAIECDEFNHDDRNIHEEVIREEYIKSLGNKIIRFNPNQKDFDLSNVLREINKILFFKINDTT